MSLFIHLIRFLNLKKAIIKKTKYHFFNVLHLSKYQLSLFIYLAKNLSFVVIFSFHPSHLTSNLYPQNVNVSEIQLLLMMITSVSTAGPLIAWTSAIIFRLISLLPPLAWPPQSNFSSAATVIYQNEVLHSTQHESQNLYQQFYLEIAFVFR